MTGTIDALTGNCPQLVIASASYNMTTSSATTFAGTACSALATGDKIEVSGIVQNNMTIALSSIKKN